MATPRNSLGQLEKDEFNLIFQAKKKRNDWKIAELLEIRKGQVIRLNRCLDNLPKEKEVVHIFVHSQERQIELIHGLWKNIMPNKRFALSKFIDIIMETLRNAENKAKDLVCSLVSVASILSSKDNREFNHRKEEVKDKSDKEDKIDKIYEITKHTSQKLKLELESASQNIEELRIQNSVLKEELEESRREEIHLRTSLKEKIEAEVTLKSTIVTIKTIHTEELSRREKEFKIEVEAFKEEMLKMKGRIRKVRRKREIVHLPMKWRGQKLEL